MAKYDSSGNRQWLEGGGGSGGESLRGIAANRSGHVYLGGYTTEAFGGETFHGGNTDAYIVRYDADGRQQWVRLLGSSARETGFGLATGPSEGVYMTGRTDSSMGGSAYSGGEQDAYVARFDSSGARQWVELIGGDDRDIGSAVTVDDMGTAYATGWTRSAWGGRNHRGGLDAFLARVR